ncbi:tyrosine-type recombinase/integrase [Patescibacteria group bacterium]|nr:tyrosine-type recombinase/integrase [Patescibacteria group bacterium]
MQSLHHNNRHETALIQSDYTLQNSQYNICTDSELALQALFSRDYSDNTRSAIAHDLKSYFKWFEKVNGEPFSLKRCSSMDIIDFRSFCQNKGLAVASVNRKLATLKQFLKTAKSEGLIEKNPAESVKHLAQQTLAPKGLTQPEVRRLLKEIELRGSLRDMLIVQLMIGAGLRVSEVANLMVQDVHISERKGYIDVRHSKARKTRQVPLNAKLRTLLTEYIETTKPTGRLFFGQRGVLSIAGIQQLVKRYAEKAGIKTHAHALRHTFAYTYLQANPSDLVGLAQILGHQNNLNVTAIYTRHRLDNLQERVELLC